MNDRTPLLLLPGLLCSAALWRAQVSGLADVADCRVMDLTADSTMPAMAARVLEQAPDTFALAGLSMGGYCALEIMRQAPERVTRLALLDTSAEPDTAERTEIRMQWIEEAANGGFEDLIPRHARMYLPASRLGEGVLAATVASSARLVGSEGYQRNQKAIAGRADSRATLGAITCPTLVLCGRQDMATPLALHEEMAEGISGARLVVIEDCAHLSPLERPDEVTAAMHEWLTAETATTDKD